MILVTGANGLLGRELLRMLPGRLPGVPIRAFDRVIPAVVAADISPAIRWWKGDLLSSSDCESACAGVQAVVHCAAVQYHSQPPRFGRERFFAQNITATQHLAAAARPAEIAVFVSSDMVYGMPRRAAGATRRSRPFHEFDPPRPLGPYGRSKHAAELAWMQAAGGRRVTAIVRPRLIIGPGRLGVLEKLFVRIAAGASVPVIGDGENRYQMVAVSDVADACIRLIERGETGVFNVGSDHPPSVNELLRGVIQRAGSPSRLVHLPATVTRAALEALNVTSLAPLAPEQYRIASVDYTLDTTRARQILGWLPRHGDADMLWAAYATWAAARSGGPAAAAARTAPRASGVKPAEISS